jgi:hypothetical protein
MLFVTSSISNDFIFINKKPASPCVASNIGRSRPHSASLHCVLFLLPPLLRSQWFAGIA